MKKYKIVVHTDQYSGSFSRELCAFMTGCTPEMGGSRAEKYIQEEVDYSMLDDLIMDELGEYGPSPVEIYPTPGWSNTGWGFCYRVGDIEGSLAKFKSEQDPNGIGRRIKPDAVAPTEEILSTFVGNAYQSVVIHLSEKPTDEQLRFLKKMAMEFPEHWPGSKKVYPPLTILGVDLLEITMEEKLIPVP